MAEARRYEARSMGSPLRLQVARAREAIADAAWRRVTAEFAASDAALSNYREDSALIAASRVLGPIPEDVRLRTALVLARRASRLTDRRFDPTVLRHLLRIGHPGLIASDGTAQDGGGEWLCVVEGTRTIELRAPVDLGGIGKGLALRWAARQVGGLGDDGWGFLLEAGGDLVARGEAPDGGAWRIGIEDPAGGEGPAAVIEVRDAAVCTSSKRIRHWETDAGAVHHLIDPRSGEPAAGMGSVTVLHADPAWAEVWSKALFVSGRDIGPLARSRGLAAWWVDDRGTLEMTPAARAATIWTWAEGDL